MGTKFVLSQIKFESLLSKYAKISNYKHGYRTKTPITGETVIL